MTKNDFLTDINSNSSNTGGLAIPGMTPEQRAKWISTLLTCLNATYILVKVKRKCFENGTWDNVLDIFYCLKKKEDNNEVNIIRESYFIFQLALILSCLALIMAIAIFLYFKSLRCLRNLIHCNFMIAMLISNIISLIMTASIIRLSESVIGCKIAVAITTYFSTTKYFWMFVEGLYLFIIVIWTYEAHKIRLGHYLVIGWGCPFVIVIIWAALLWKYDKGNNPCWLPFDKSFSIHSIIVISCCVVIGVNMIVVIAVVWVLIRKLRMSPTIELRQIKKSVKAICVLLPLLGAHFPIIYAAEFVSPHMKTISIFIRNILQAFQGLSVALFYCFLNSDVLALLRQRINAAQESRSIQRYQSSILRAKSGTSIPDMSSSSCNAISKTRKPKEFDESDGFVHDPATRLSMMGTSV